MHGIARACLSVALMSGSGCTGIPAPSGPTAGIPVATFSIVARDPANGDLGIAVTSKFLAVGAVVPWAQADVGAVATQAWANTSFGPEGLRRLAAGEAPADALAAMLAADADGRDRRQVGLVDAKGRVAAHTGTGCLAWAGHVTGEGYTCQGNILVGEAVVTAMAKAFEAAKGELADRLLAGLAAGYAAGGDRRPGHDSAALLVVRARGGYSGWNDRYIDLRVDDHAEAVTELRRLNELHRKIWKRPAVAPTGDPGK